jgi:hypothetical protein
MKVTVNIRDILTDNADHNDMLLYHGGVDIGDLLDTNSIAEEQELDVHDLLAERHAIGLIWEADQLLSHYPHLTKSEAWEVLQECERNYKGEEGLCWDDIAEAVTEMFPDPEEVERREARPAKAGAVIAAYGAGCERENLVDLLADAMHWCEGFGEPFEEFYGSAMMHFTEEAKNHKKGA